MRGKGTCCQCAFGNRGITPAHAGKSKEILEAIRHDEDHPRPCGEKTHAGAEKVPELGSPPPMRGKVVSHTYKDVQRRITPAHAGKRCSMLRLASRLKDHPRPCGEKPRGRGGNLPELGSPPPMRGKVPWHAIGVVCCGITPAHAGKRKEELEEVLENEDHPRPCGEKLYSNNSTALK